MMSIGWALSYSMSDQDLVAPRVEVVAAAESYRDRAAAVIAGAHLSKCVSVARAQPMAL